MTAKILISPSLSLARLYLLTKYYIMHVTKGHLTATEKRHIKHLLSLNVLEGKINRKTYHIESLGGGRYDVAITENLTRWCEDKPKITTTKHSFTN